MLAIGLSISNGLHPYSSCTPKIHNKGNKKDPKSVAFTEFLKNIQRKEHGRRKGWKS